MNDILNTIATPFAALLLFLYENIGSYGLAIIMFSLIIKLILLPFSYKSKKSMLKMSGMTAKLKELEKKCGGDKDRYAVEMQKLYAREGVSPMGGCLWSFIPLPVMLALYSAIRLPLTNLMRLTKEQVALVGTTLTGLGVTLTANETYAEIEMANYTHQFFEQVRAVVPDVVNIDFSFLGLNLSMTPTLKFWETDGGLGLFLIPIISGAASLLSAYVMSKYNKLEDAPADDKMNAASSKSMLVMMPIMSLWFGFVMPASMGVYWIANSVFAMLQDLILGKYLRKKLKQEAAERQAREEAEALEAAERNRLTADARQERNIDARKNVSRAKQKQQAKEAQIEAKMKARQKKLEEQEEMIRQYKEAKAKKDAARGKAPQKPAQKKPVKEVPPPAPVQEKKKKQAPVDDDRPYARGRARVDDDRPFARGRAYHDEEETSTQAEPMQDLSSSEKE